MNTDVPILKIEMQVTEETYQRIRHVTYPDDLPKETSVFQKDFLQNLLVFIETRQELSDHEIGLAIIDVTDWKNESRSTIHRHGITIDNWLTVYQPDTRSMLTVVMDFSQVDADIALPRYMAIQQILHQEVQGLNSAYLTSPEATRKLQEANHRTPTIQMSQKEIEDQNEAMREFLLNWINEPEYNASDHVHELRDLMVQNFGGQVAEGLEDDVDIYDLRTRLTDLGLLEEKSAVDALVAGAPASLNTLNELAKEKS